MQTVDKVSVTELIEKEGLKNLTPDIDTDHKYITIPDVNRPALQLAGFFDQFDSERVQIIGNVETAYLMTFDAPERRAKYAALSKYPIPVIIYARGIEPDSCMIDACRNAGIPLLQSTRMTTELEATIISWLKVRMAPMISVHGVLVDVYGEGVLIMGDSGIGKSEAALELIKRGHRLVADDVVELRKVSDDTLVGSAPDNIRHFIELRGVGIINARRIFGMGAVKMTEKIDMVVQLEPWDNEKVYDRLGLDNEYVEILGINIPLTVVPVKPGRNLSIIIEAAAMNNRQKKMGYNAARELLHSLGMTDDIVPEKKELEVWHDF